MGRKKKVKSDKINLEEILQNENYKIGNFRRNERGFGFVNIGEEEIFISPKLTKSALDGDNVLIKIFEDKDFENMDKQKREGMVVKIIKHENDTLVGTYKKSRNFGFVIPDNKSVSEDVYIPKKKSAGARNNQKVVVRIDKYADENNKAEGTIVEIIGGIDEAGVDMLSLIKEYRLPNEFPQNVIDEAIAIPQILDESNIQKRVDLRNEEIFTIDGEDAKDLDDAVNVKKNDDGTYTLGVHIADVSYYVKSGSKLDKEAIKRGTSIYMMDRVIPMLPKELSNGICSLNENQDRFTISVIMKIDEKGKVVDSDVFKSVIRVTKKMSYNKVYKVICNEDDIVLKEYKEYISDIMLMKELAIILNKKRKNNGSINFDIPETKVLLDENKKVVGIKPYEITIANKIIEEFMLAANMQIAEKFFFLDIPFIYRIHEKPDEEKLRDFNEILSSYKLRLKGIKNIHPKSLSDIIDNIEREEEKQIISSYMLRTLKLAKYSEECLGHFGLASKYYCHFTSPIRRYPDLFIHRVISDYIESGYILSDKKINKYAKQAVEYSKSSNETEKQATLIERDFDDLYKCIYMNKFIGENFDAVISNVTSFGIFVRLENTVEGLISFDNINDMDYYIYDEKKHRLVGKNTSRVFKIGDKLTVKLVKADVRLKEIDFMIV